MFQSPQEHLFRLHHKPHLLKVHQHLAEQKLSVNRWISDHKWLEVDFSDQPEAFFNVNTQEQLEQAEKLVTLPL